MNRRVADNIRVGDDQDDVPIVQLRNARYIPYRRGDVFALEYILFVCTFESKFLFDTGATLQFMSLYIAMRLDRQLTLLGFLISVYISVDEKLILVKYVYQNCEIEIGDKILMGDLNVLDMIDFDVILGINISEVCVSKL